jgi:hypothetical protein|tara:strand:+ start:20 stop:646 length:627 start_codon:yes stop_codon:yes gene_type:complete
MATNNAPRGLQVAKKNGDGSNSTGVRTIDLNPCSPLVASALVPSDIFTGDPIAIEAAGTIKPCADGVSIKSAGVFQGCSFVNASGEQKFARSITGGVTATDVKIHIASDPAQTFFIQADATVTAAAGFGVGVFNGVYIAGTGSHKTGQSGYVLDASGPILSTGNLRVIRRAPWDTGIGASIGVTDAYPWYEVRIANHMDNFITATITG